MITSNPASRGIGWISNTSAAASISAVLFAVYAGWMLTGGTGPRSVEIVGVVTSVAVTAAGAIVSGRAAAVADGRARCAWVAVSLGLVAANVAEILWGAGHLLDSPLRSPSIADAAYLLFPLGMLTGLLLFPGWRGRKYPARLILDGLIMAGSLLIVSWLTVMRPAYAAGANSGAALAVTLAYPLTNLVTLTVATVVLARAGVGARPMLTLLTLGLLSMTAAESVFAYLSVGEGPLHGRHVIEIGWTAGMVLIALAGAQGRHTVFDEPADAPPGWASVWLPYAPLMLATLVMAVVPGPVINDRLVLVCLIVVVPAVLVRQVMQVAENQRLIATVVDLAMHDPLTGLANRALFGERLRDALRPRAPESSVAVLMLDLDGFKAVNDTLGHACGDELLVAVAGRLRSRIGEGPTIARLGGDEFAVLMEDSPEAAHRMTERLREVFDEPFAIDGHRLLIGSGIGMATGRTGQTTADALLKDADLSMYAAKRRRTGQSSTAPRSGGPMLLADLRDAIDGAGLTMVYQPKVRLATGDVVGVEALLRWPHPRHGLLLPGQFLPMVRSHGLMEAINDLVLRLALDDVLRWQREGVEVPVAVNIFAPTLDDHDLPGRVTAAVAERGLRTDLLTLELTEDLPVARIGPTKLVLSELRDRGVRISIDDFGAGYAALSYLMHLPVDEVKLDRGFLGPSLSGHRVESVVRMTVGLAHELGLNTVAEGVTDGPTLDRLAAWGVDIAQGDHIGAPVAAGLVPGLFSGRGPITTMPSDGPGVAR